jgi:hypothetical protein
VSEPKTLLEVTYYFYDRRLHAPSALATEAFYLDEERGDSLNDLDPRADVLAVNGGVVTIPKGWVMRGTRRVPKPEPKKPEQIKS